MELMESLTKMLIPICEDKLAVEATKKIIKKWLSQVAIGAETRNTLRMRDTLVILVDEP
jgi:hypothetical protein